MEYSSVGDWYERLQFPNRLTVLVGSEFSGLPRVSIVVPFFG